MIDRVAPTPAVVVEGAGTGVVGAAVDAVPLAPAAADGAPEPAAELVDPHAVSISPIVNSVPAKPTGASRCVVICLVPTGPLRSTLTSLPGPIAGSVSTHDSELTPMMHALACSAMAYKRSVCSGVPPSPTH